MSRDWARLYALQDKVLEEISSIGSIALRGEIEPCLVPYIRNTIATLNVYSL